MTDNHTSIAGAVLASVINRYSVHPDDSYYVVLTREMADHLADMYYKTDWDMEDVDTINLPEDIFTGDLDRKKLDAHIGEYIRMNQACDPIDNIFSLETFPPYFSLYFENDFLESFTDDCEDFFGGTYEQGYIITSSLENYISLALKNGKDEKQILKEVGKKIR